MGGSVYVWNLNK
jgi:katanin p80 WD40 repeat-containing subunit B1